METSGQFHIPTASVPGTEPPYPSDRGLGGPQSSVWTLWSSEMFLASVGNRTRAIQPVASLYTILPLLYLVVRVPGCRMEMCCVSCEVRTEFIYVMQNKLDGFDSRRYQIF
jgi:hypothetical protein